MTSNPPAETGPARQGSTERCANPGCGHTKRDHSGRVDHREKHGALVAGDPWCHACNAACDYAPVAQQPAAADETDEERADREATERDHARGDHAYCGITCEAEMPTEHLRNFVIAKGYPGTKGALDELLRRARAEVAAQQPAAADSEETRRG